MTRIGVAGTGAIGSEVALALAGGAIEGCVLSGFAARTPARAEEHRRALGIDAPDMDFAALAKASDIVVECLPPALFADLAELVLRAGRTLVALSASQILDRGDLVDLARDTGGRIVVPSGAILGLDAVRAAAEGGIRSVTVTTRKPPAGLMKAPFVQREGIDLSSLTEARRIIAGPVREVAREFPANVNVAAAVSLAGIGPDRTRMEVWADPALTRNTHSVEVDSQAARLSMTIESAPSARNPASAAITPLSVIALLRGLHAPLRVGT